MPERGVSPCVRLVSGPRSYGRCMWRCPGCRKSLIERYEERERGPNRPILAADTVVVKGRVRIEDGFPVIVGRNKHQGWHQPCLDADTDRINAALRKPATPDD
jgi:hypothetical protein